MWSTGFLLLQSDFRNLRSRSFAFAQDFGARLTPRKRLNFCNLTSNF